MTNAPVEPKLAATVVLTRPGRDGLEILLTRRPGSMAFAPGMHVFPGGRIDAADRDPELQARSLVSATAAAEALGGDLDGQTALSTFVAAIRELFEEAGVLLVHDVAGAVPPQRSLGEARSGLVGGDASFATIAADLDLRLRTDLLVPLSRWVTPPTLTRRFDARFFAAALPDGARVSLEGGEVEAHAWLTAADALDAMAAGTIEMWLPTSATLQQLRHVESLDQLRAIGGPGRLGSVDVRTISPEVSRIVMPAGGGVAGQPINAYLVGRRRLVFIDPGDPTGPALDKAMEMAAERGGSIDAIALTQAEPDHAGGTEALAEILGIPVFGGPGAGRHLPYAVHELLDGGAIPAGDATMRAVWTPGPTPEHLAFVIGDAHRGGSAIAVAGDLDGQRGARTIPGPTDDAASARSRARLEAIVPSSRWLTSHAPDPSPPAA